MMFTSPQASHAHSLRTLNLFYEYDDFMASLSTVADMGCGQGLDLEWWVTRTTRDELATPLGIKCIGIDLPDNMSMAQRYKNITYHQHDFEKPVPLPHKIDLIWCHDAFQYAINPIQTLTNWYNMTTEGAMLCLIVPQTTNLEFNHQAFDQQDYCYYNWTMVSLIHILTICGWDCSSGFFLKEPDDPWLHAIVYKSTHKPMDPRTTRWYHIAEKDLLPKSAKDSVMKHGYLRQRDLLLPWLDRSLRYLDKY